MQAYEVYLFDADNTLYDYDKSEAYALSQMLGSIYSDDIRALFRQINHTAWGRWERGEISKQDMQVWRFKELLFKIGLNHDAEDFNTKYLSYLGGSAFLIDGAEEVCRKIAEAGSLIYIATNGIAATQQARIGNSSIHKYISVTFVSEEVGHQKPDVRFFNHIFANIPPVTKDKILMIGDNIAADIAGGKNAGIDTCWFNPACVANTSSHIPTYEIRSLFEITGGIE